MVNLLVPENYGKEKEATLADAFRYGGDCKAAKQREYEIEKTIREFGEKTGIVFVENPDLRDATDTDEYTLKGHETTDLEEQATVRNICPEITIPQSRTFQEFLQYPTFPVVAKPFMINGHPWFTSQGDFKYLIEKRVQFEKMRAFLTQRELPFPEGHQWEGHYANNQPPGIDSFYYQDFIDTPGDRFTSLRVMASVTGRILCSSLLYSAETKDNVSILESNSDHYSPSFGDDVADFLTLPNSPVFLGAKNIFSNRAKGGGGIVLDPIETSKRPTKKEEKILKSHGFDPNSPELPPELREMSSKIAREYGRKKGLIVGIDWIKGQDGKWYYLETNIQPGLQTYLDHRSNGKGNEVETYLSIYKDLLMEISQIQSA